MADGLLARTAAGAELDGGGEALQVIRVAERHADDGDVGIERIEIVARGANRGTSPCPGAPERFVNPSPR